MDVLRNQVKKIVILKVNGVIENLEDGLLEESVSEVEQYILNYCRINKIPKELLYTWANIIVDYLMYVHARLKSLNDGIDLNMGDVSGIKVGDVDTKFGSQFSTNPFSQALKSHKPNLDSVILNYKEQLQLFRNMAW